MIFLISVMAILASVYFIFAPRHEMTKRFSFPPSAITALKPLRPDGRIHITHLYLGRSTRGWAHIVGLLYSAMVLFVGGPVFTHHAQRTKWVGGSKSDLLAIHLVQTNTLNRICHLLFRAAFGVREKWMMTDTMYRRWFYYATHWTVHITLPGAELEETIKVLATIESYTPSVSEIKVLGPHDPFIRTWF